jgi:hypothetical protein
MGTSIMHKLYYSDKTEYDILVKESHEKGETVLHNNFIDVNGKSTDGNSGELVLSISDNSIESNKFKKGKILRTKLINDIDSFTFEELKELIRLSISIL